MLVSGFLVDTNLLVLWVAGSVNTDIIARHKRLQDYTAAEYEALLDLVNLADRVFVTPDTLTEASNLLSQHGEPERSLLMGALRVLIDNGVEIVVPSAQAATNPVFQRMGLADAALLEAVSEETPLITADLELYSLALAKEPNAAWNFWGEGRADRVPWQRNLPTAAPLARTHPAPADDAAI